MRQVLLTALMVVTLLATSTTAGTATGSTFGTLTTAKALGQGTGYFGFGWGN